MTAVTLTLADFLLARIAEDEAVAQSGESWGATPANSWDNGLDNLAGGYWDEPWVIYNEGGSFARTEAAWPVEHLTRFDPARVLAEIDAKRQIVKFASAAIINSDAAPDDAHEAHGYASAYEQVTQYLALPYAEHPDYRQEWRP